MNQHLVEISHNFAEDAHAVLIINQAGWHIFSALIFPANITILPRPPKSHELNPIENLWQFMRNSSLSNRAFKSYDDIVIIATMPGESSNASRGASCYRPKKIGSEFRSLSAGITPRLLFWLNRKLRQLREAVPVLGPVHAMGSGLGADYAQGFPDVHRALYIFMRWQHPAEAAKLVTRRVIELDGAYYELMTPAADALSKKHLLAATIILRAMVDLTLESSRSRRYKHAARHPAECRLLSKHGDDLGPLASHEAFVANLRHGRGRKSTFWSHVPNAQIKEG